MTSPITPEQWAMLHRRTTANLRRSRELVEETRRILERSERAVSHASATIVASTPRFVLGDRIDIGVSGRQGASPEA